MFKGLALAAVAATFAALFLASTASAQYPPPKGSLVCTTTAAIEVKSVEVPEAVVLATLRDAAGKPVAGETVYFQIVGGSGNLNSSSAQTNSSGVASVGMHGSNTTVAATNDGLECRTVAQVLGSRFQPPSTGDAGLAGTAGSISVFGLALVIMAVSGLGIVLLQRRRLAR